MIDRLVAASKETILGAKKAKGIEFNELWKNVAKKCNLKPDDDLISDFYQELIENHDFVKVDNKHWTLRELISYDQFNIISKSLFSNNLDSDVEENFQDFMSQTEIKEAKHAFKNSDTASLEIENEEIVEEDEDAEFQEDLGDEHYED